MPLTKHRHTCAHRNGRQPTCLSDHADGDCQGKEVSMHPGFCTAPTREAEDSRHLMSGARPYDAGLVSPRLLCPIRTRRVCVEELQKQCSFKKKWGAFRFPRGAVLVPGAIGAGVCKSTHPTRPGDRPRGVESAFSPPPQSGAVS